MDIDHAIVTRINKNKHKNTLETAEKTQENT